MTLAESKQKMLHYMREAYMNNGAVPDNQNLDFTSAHNTFANTEQKFLSYLYCPIRKVETVDVSASGTGETELTLPSDLKQVKDVYVRRYVSDLSYRERCNVRIGFDGKVYVPSSKTATYTVEYVKRLDEITDSTADTVSYEIADEWQELIPIKCAILALIDVRQDVAGALQTRYNELLGQLVNSDTGRVMPLKTVANKGGW